MDHPPRPPEVLELPPPEPEAPVGASQPAPHGAGSPDSAASSHPPRRIPPTASRVLATVAVVFVTTFLFLRTFLVEPFGVPTGSMAPTLLGHHREVPCPRCGYPVRVGEPQDATPLGHYQNVPCPNCGRLVDLSDAPTVNGDRLLVDKNVYQIRSPRRWEVAVFRCAADLSKPYVKRVVGLPGESIRIVGGDVYADGELLRKSFPEIREVAIPVFDLGYSPDPDGWGPRWIVYPPEGDFRLPVLARDAPVPEPAGPDVLDGGALVLDASASPQTEIRVEYRHWDLDGRREVPIRSENSYDGSQRGSGHVYPVHDFYLTCEVEVEAADHPGSFACRLNDGADRVTANVPVGPAAGPAFLNHDKDGGLSAAGGVVLEPGGRYKIEFALIDRRASLAIDGERVMPPADLPAVRKRAEVTRPLQLRARGCRVRVYNLKLSRDIHYTRGGTHGTRQPAQLGADEYFVLGDNSGNSQDSREWDHPGVPEADFIGKPILIHQPLRPGRLTVGGKERVVQTLDWSRLRWLH